MEVLKELAGDETAYRSLTRSWFENSPLWQALQKAAQLFKTQNTTGYYEEVKNKIQELQQ